MRIPGFGAFCQSKWAYDHVHWIARLPFMKPISIMITSMYDIRAISRTMLEEKTTNAAVDPNDTHAKKDIMSLLVRAQAMDKSEGYHMSEHAMVDQVLTFLGAGHETTATGLTWTMWLLAKHPEVQEKLRKEVNQVLEVNGRPEYRTLKEMQWLDCVVMESLRVMPPVPFTGRISAQDQFIDGYLVPKGSGISIPIYAINTWKEVWGEDAEEFKPERWLNLPKQYNAQFSTIGFLAGPHACIGKTMAILEMKAVAAMLVANFEFSPAYPGQVAHPTAAITMKPEDNMPLRVTLVDRSL